MQWILNRTLKDLINCHLQFNFYGGFIFTVTSLFPFYIIRCMDLNISCFGLIAKATYQLKTHPRSRQCNTASIRCKHLLHFSQCNISILDFRSCHNTVSMWETICTFDIYGEGEYIDSLRWLDWGIILVLYLMVQPRMAHFSFSQTLAG